MLDKLMKGRLFLATNKYIVIQLGINLLFYLLFAVTGLSSDFYHIIGDYGFYSLTGLLLVNLVFFIYNLITIKSKRKSDIISSTLFFICSILTVIYALVILSTNNIYDEPTTRTFNYIFPFVYVFTNITTSSGIGSTSFSIDFVTIYSLVLTIILASSYIKFKKLDYYDSKTLGCYLRLNHYHLYKYLDKEHSLNVFLSDLAILNNYFFIVERINKEEVILINNKKIKDKTYESKVMCVYSLFLLTYFLYLFIINLNCLYNVKVSISFATFIIVPTFFLLINLGFFIYVLVNKDEVSKKVFNFTLSSLVLFFLSYLYLLINFIIYPLSNVKLTSYSYLILVGIDNYIIVYIDLFLSLILFVFSLLLNKKKRNK